MLSGRHSRHRIEIGGRDANRQRGIGDTADVSREMVLRLIEDEFRGRSHIARERMGGCVADLRSEFYRGRTIQRVKNVRLHLLQSLMRKDQAYVELTRLVKNDRDLGVTLDEILAFVNVDETGEALLLGKKLALMRGEQDHRNEKPSNDLHTVLLQEALRDIDENNFPSTHFGEEIELGLWRCKHSRQGTDALDGEQTVDDLLFCAVELFAVELQLKEASRIRIELGQMLLELREAAGLHQVNEGVDRSRRNIEQKLDREMK